jgi:hypothetical protein
LAYDVLPVPDPPPSSRVKAVKLARMTPESILAGPDYLSAWIRVDRLIHRVVGQRVNHGSTPELDAQFDRLIILHRWLERRLAK